MINSTNTLDADLDYAERMVRKGYGTAELAAKVCGVCLADLQARLARSDPRQNAMQQQSRPYR